MDNRFAERLLNVYQSIERDLGRTVLDYQESFGSRKDGSYIMIPLNPLHFVEMLTKASDMLGDHWGKKFVDVGAGAGFKVRIAQEMFGYDATGIEYDKKYVDFAIKYLGFGKPNHWNSERMRLIHKNAFDVNYKEFDVIYFYRPLGPEELQTKLEKHIIATMRDDALVIGAMNACLYREMEQAKPQAYHNDIIFYKKGCAKHFKFPKEAAAA